MMESFYKKLFRAIRYNFFPKNLFLLNKKNQLLGSQLFFKQKIRFAKKRFSLLSRLGFILLLPNLVCFSQVLTFEEFIKKVKENHPVAKQSELFLQEGDNLLLLAKSSMDPKILSDFQQKEFAKKLYYSYWENELNIPVFGGLDIYSNYSTAQGDFLNQQNKLPQNGLIQLGIKADIFGLWNNKRNLGIQKAKLQRKATEFERQILLNYLFFDATNQYLEWSKDYEILNTHKQFIEIAKERYENVKQLHQLGEIPAIDTLEAHIQYQNRVANFNDSFMNFVDSSIKASNYLWNNSSDKSEVITQQFPENLQRLVTKFSNMSDENFLSTHPFLQKYTNKIEQLTIEQKLRKRELLPNLYAKYNFLNDGANFANQLQFLPNNYNFGFTFSFPLFNRVARAQLSLNKIEIQQTQFDRKLKEIELIRQIQVIKNQQENLEKQLTLFQTMNENYKTLLEVQKQKSTYLKESLYQGNLFENL